MKTDELREKYLSFFESKGCVRRPSDVLVPKDDPTVLFTPAGMNQFKNEFLGIGKLEFTRATTVQKCLRTGDISNVGVTAYHHTFFEMLGNFSFGDYFKKEAIHWAWEFLTDAQWLGLDPSRLTVSVYEDDDEAYDIWHKEIRLDAARIRRDNEDENFWPAGAPTQGPDGVCGPCSEIFYTPPGLDKEVEIWNLVFTQFNRVGDPPDNLRPLPKKNIDTGMGLERTASVLQGVVSNFEIDILRPLCEAAGEIVGTGYEFQARHGRAIRRIADHIRAVTFCVHEGVTPGSEKESYVVRQLLRRAQLEGYILGQHDPFLYQLVPNVVDIMKQPYPELKKTLENVVDVVEKEETQFLETVDRGLAKFNKFVERAGSSGSKTISGDDAFDLHQTEGFFIELTEALAEKQGLTVDRVQFQERMKRHQLDSGRGAFAGEVMAEGPLETLQRNVGASLFLGYETTSAKGVVLGMICEKQVVESAEASHQTVGVVLDQTPFYAEAGGQVGDTGRITAGDCVFEVADTQRHRDLILHIGHVVEGTLQVGQEVTAQVDAQRRAGIRRAHSATHLLHHALHCTIGETATQRGSKVEDDALRFDFAHKQALNDEQLRQVEDIINARIAEGAPVQTRMMKLEDARAAGAMALFGEKYPDEVRVVQMGEFSRELCGGTHLSNTGQVGFCKIVNEEPVAKGVRRVTALTGPKALDRIRETESILKQMVLLLKTPQPEDLPQRVERLQDELRDVKRKLAKLTSASVADAAGDLIEKAPQVGDVRIVVHQAPDLSREALRDFADEIRQKAAPAAVLVGTVIDGKVALTAAVSKDLVKRGVSASDCVRQAAKVAGGGGGGRPDLAEAGARFPDKLDEALETGAAYYRGVLEK